MNRRLALQAARRAVLVAESSMQRQLLIEEFARWEAPLQGAERVLARVAWARAHLRWVIAAGVALAASPTMRGWLMGGWQVWRMARRLQAIRSR